jgi:hypothetical protein
MHIDIDEHFFFMELDELPSPGRSPSSPASPVDLLRLQDVEELRFFPGYHCNMTICDMRLT